MKNQSEISENKENYRGGGKWYREKIVEMVNRIDNENYLLKIYSFVKVFFED